MEKLELIQHARTYIDALSVGIDPISNTPVPNDSVLQQDRLKKCFTFISEILSELIDNNGFISDLGLAENPTSDNTRLNPETFCLSSQQIQDIKVSNSLILPSAFVKRINAVVPQGLPRMSLPKINKWLVHQGYLLETRVATPTIVNKRVRSVLPTAAEIGVLEQLVVDRRTGEAKLEIFFSKEAQEFILQHINEIAQI